MNTLITTATTAAGHWDGDRPDYWPIFPILWVLVIAGGIATAVLLGRRRQAAAGARAGETVLAQRFAAGEIDDEEYSARLSVLRRR